MKNLSRKVRRSFSVGATVLPVLLLLTFTAASAATVGGSAAPVVEALNSFRNSFIIPVFIAVAGIAFVVAVIGLMFRPDKKELFTQIAAIALTAMIGVGGGSALVGILTNMNGGTATTGFSIF